MPNHPGLRWSTVLDDPARLLRGMSVGDAIRLLDLKPQYQHLLRSDPALWDKAVSDALREGVPSNATDAAKVLEAAIRRQVDGHP